MKSWKTTLAQKHDEWIEVMMQVSLCGDFFLSDNWPEVDDIFGSYILDSRAASEFRYDNALNKLVALELVVDGASTMAFHTAGQALAGDAEYGQVGNPGYQGRLMKLASWIDLDSKVTVR